MYKIVILLINIYAHTHTNTQYMRLLINIKYMLVE